MLNLSSELAVPQPLHSSTTTESEYSKRMASFKDLLKSSKPVVSMLLVQAIATGMQLLSKVILSDGTFIFALMTYRHIVASLCVAPFALYFERGNQTKLSLKAWFWIFMSASTGISIAMAFYYYGLRDTTATFATNLLNLVPIVTFVFSIVSRVEALRLFTWAGKVKAIGALLCVTGALTTSLYKGKSFYFSHHHALSHDLVKNIALNWTRGTCFLIASCLSYGIWFVMQGNLIEVFPSKYWSIMLTCIIASIQSAFMGVYIDRSMKSWKLKWNLQLITIFYSGALATAATFCLISWTISKRGPAYPSMFNPLTLIFVATLEALILGEEIRLGTLLGTVLILIGIYSFLWAKNKELKNERAQSNVGAAAADVELETTVIDSTVVSPTAAIIVASNSPEVERQKSESVDVAVRSS